VAASTYERLSLEDSLFLALETTNTPLHLGATAIFDAAPLATPDGGVDLARIRAHIASRLGRVPRYRQRLAYTPLEGHPIWVDDADFDLRYHVRHAGLPQPGDERQLKRFVGEIMSQALDHRKPLWEVWVVEGLGGGRFAFVVKAHHCMADGVAAVALFSALLSPLPDEPIEPGPPPWTSRPSPTALELLQNEVLRGARLPLELAQAVSAAVWEPREATAGFTDGLISIWRTLRAGLQGAADIPLNGPIGPHRRFDWLSVDLADARAVKARLRGTVNDVILATVAGALGRYLKRHGVDPKTIDYRAIIPVNVRSSNEDGTLGNRASGWLTSLPIQERNPRRRLAKVRALTTNLKASKQALGFWSLLGAADWAAPLLATFGPLTAWLRPYNLIVTNVAGPQLPLYLCGARLLAVYPLVPLFEHQGLGVAVLSYAGTLFFGVNADRDRVRDLHEFVEALSLAFGELREAAGLDGSDVVPAAPDHAVVERTRDPTGGVSRVQSA
jgi:diacylglycerol O-acyltransferase / wax synthase